MNYCVVSGTIVGNIVSELDKELSCTKFNIKNLYYKSKKSVSEKTIIRCICYGALADYVYNELYEGANIVVTGRILRRKYVIENKNNMVIYHSYIGCSTVSILEQEEYR